VHAAAQKDNREFIKIKAKETIGGELGESSRLYSQ